MNHVMKRIRSVPRGAWLAGGLLLLSGLLFALAFLHLYAEPKVTPEPPALQEETQPTEPAETEPTEPTEPEMPEEEETAQRASYTVAREEGIAQADLVAARMGDAELTNGVLQLWYLEAIAQAAASENGPDLTQPLDAQSYDEETTWQRHLLMQAIAAWQREQALVLAAQQPQIITEEAFRPDEFDTMHEKYIDPALPVNHFLYADKEQFVPNSLHQAHLDSLKKQMEDLAKAAGYASLSDYAQTIGGIAAGDCIQAAYNRNLAYMYFTERSYAVQAPAAAVKEYVRAHKDSLPQGRTVDFRQILFLPQDAAIAPDGTVTAEDARWESCMRSASDYLQGILNAGIADTPAKNSFALAAVATSKDAGSRMAGGLYTDVRPGQLAPELDAWLFAPEREAGDAAVIRAASGVHILMVSAADDAAETAARGILERQIEALQWKELLENTPVEVDDAAVALWVQPDLTAISVDETLYPDVAHQRFPEVMVYLQQDYYTTPFGKDMLGKAGCGITTFAMLTTYMTDSYQTPAMMASRYTNYSTGGTDGMLFYNETSDFGFYLDRMAFDLDEVIEALQNGQLVVSLQHGGDFTTGNHYILIERYFEEDGTFQVRDSNIYNYASRPGHRIDRFTAANILSGGAHFYIFQPKLTRVPACSRCGTEAEQQGPACMFREEYLCGRCLTAVARRENFTNLLSEGV